MNWKNRLGALACAALVSTGARAQIQTDFVPSGTGGRAGSSNTGALRIGGGLFQAMQPNRFQVVLDGATLQQAGLPQGPALLLSVSFRSDESGFPINTWPGGTEPAASLDLSTAALSPANASTQFAANHGSDRAQVWSGSLTVGSSSFPDRPIGIEFITIDFQQPFPFDTNNDLVIDFGFSGALSSGWAPLLDAEQGLGAQATLLTTDNQGFAPPNISSATTALPGVTPVLRFDWLQGQSPQAAFEVDSASGDSPLTVQFTDASVTTDPGGIRNWAWDFESDGIIDSTLQNPTHTYAGCGDRSVTLQISDGTNTASATRTDLIQVDPLSLTVGPLPPKVLSGQPADLTATTTPGATVSWDFDRDGVVDGVGTRVQHVFSSPGPQQILVTAQRLCRQIVRSVTIDVEEERVLQGPVNPGAGTTRYQSGFPDPVKVFFDVTVTEPLGVVITELDLPVIEASGGLLPYTARIWARRGTTQGLSNAPPSQQPFFTLVASGARVIEGQTTSVGRLDITDFALPPGTTGLMLTSLFGSVEVNQSAAGLTSSGPGLSITSWGATTGATTDPVSGNRNAVTTAGFAGSLVYRPARPGELAPFGGGCPSSAGEVQLVPATVPTLGAPFSIIAQGMPAAGSVVLHGGISRTANLQFGIPLPFDLSQVLSLAPRCFFQVSSDVILPAALPGPSGDATITTAIPNNPALSAIPLYLQAVVFDPAVQGSIALTDAWLGTIR